MKTPDITKAQILAVAGAAIGVAVAFGAPLSQDQQFALLALVAAVAAVLIHEDVKLRGKRLEHLDALKGAQPRPPHLTGSSASETVNPATGSATTVRQTTGTAAKTTATKKKAKPA